VRAGATQYLTKPAEPDEIEAAFGGPAVATTTTTTTTATTGSDALPVPSLDRVEWEHLQRVLADCDGNVSEAARRLGLHRRTLQRKLHKRPPKR
jgi:two-component system response regulator RegA